MPNGARECHMEDARAKRKAHMSKGVRAYQTDGAHAQGRIWGFSGKFGFSTENFVFPSKSLGFP
jgi:hypothetical protein